MDIKIEYDGAYPCLCMGHLKVTIDGTLWDFGEFCLTSGGSVWFDADWMDHVAYGSWTISKWPENFPRELKDVVLEAVNNEIPQGCCGGCI